MLLQDTTLKELKRPSVSPAQRTQLHQFDVTSFESMKVRLFTAGWWLVVEPGTFPQETRVLSYSFHYTSWIPPKGQISSTLTNKPLVETLLKLKITGRSFKNSSMMHSANFKDERVSRIETTQPFPNESSVVINEVALEPISTSPAIGSCPPKMYEDGIDKHETHQKWLTHVHLRAKLCRNYIHFSRLIPDDKCILLVSSPNQPLVASSERSSIIWK